MHVEADDFWILFQPLDHGGTVDQLDVAVETLSFFEDRMFSMIGLRNCRHPIIITYETWLDIWFVYEYNWSRVFNPPSLDTYSVITSKVVQQCKNSGRCHCHMFAEYEMSHGDSDGVDPSCLIRI